MFKSRQEPGIELGPCGRKAEILSTAPTMPAKIRSILQCSFDFLITYIFDKHNVIS